jgi:hypothetical protein
MNSLSRYILRNLVIAAIFVTLALSFAVWLSQALRLLELVAGGNAPVSTFLGLLVLTLPNFLYVILPIARRAKATPSATAERSAQSFRASAGLAVSTDSFSMRGFS